MGTIFNKNHITITKENNLVRKSYKSTFKPTIIYDNGNGYSSYKPYYVKEKTEIVKKKSPLGFYYMSEQKIRQNYSGATLKKFIITLSNHKYVITYPYESNGQYLSVDLRPWNLIEGDKGFDDHYIEDLMNDINLILTEIEEEKSSIIYSEKQSLIYKKSNEIEYSPHDAKQLLKDVLYKDLFGSTKGIRFQTDLEKVVSHGFDEKISFRKRKEE